MIVDSFSEPIKADTFILPASTQSQSHSGKKHTVVKSQLIELQQKTLDSVRELVDVENEKLRLMKEVVVMKRAKLFLQGCMQDEDGNWVTLIAPSANATQFLPSSEE